MQVCLCLTRTIEFHQWYLFLQTFSNTFEVFDENKDGVIDFKEFILGMALSNATDTDVDSRIEFFFRM